MSQFLPLNGNVTPIWTNEVHNVLANLISKKYGIIPKVEADLALVLSLNSIQGHANIVAGSNITVNVSGNDITISSTGGGGGGVTSFNTRTGAVTLTSTDVTDALTYTPVNPTRAVNTGTGLTGGGNLTADRTLSVVDDTTNQKVNVLKNGTSIGTRKSVNLIEGSNVTMTVADNAGSNRVDVTVNATGGGTISEPNTQIVYGTGTGIDSSEDFLVNPANGAFRINFYNTTQDTGSPAKVRIEARGISPGNTTASYVENLEIYGGTNSRIYAGSSPRYFGGNVVVAGGWTLNQQYGVGGTISIEGGRSTGSNGIGGDIILSSGTAGTEGVAGSVYGNILLGTGGAGSATNAQRGEIILDVSSSVAAFGTASFIIDKRKNVIAAPSTTEVTGGSGSAYFWYPTVPSPPSAAPVTEHAVKGAPLAVDRTNNRLYTYVNSAWRYIPFVSYTPANKAGDTFTGNVTVQGTTSSYYTASANGTIGSQYVSFGMFSSGGVVQWQWGWETDRSFSLWSYNDTGTYIARPMNIARDGTAVYFTGRMFGNGGGNGIGALTLTTTSGTPSGGSTGDIKLVY